MAVIADGGDAYILTVAGGGSVTLWSAQLEDYAIEEVRFADQSVWTAQDLYDLAFGQQQMAMFAGFESFGGGERMLLAAGLLAPSARLDDCWHAQLV